MKKLYTAITLLLFGAAPAGAQTYYPLLDSVNEWSYTIQLVAISQFSPQSVPCSYPVYEYSPFRQYTTADTIIDSLSYKTVMNSSQLCVMGYLREDTAAQKVYFVDNQFNPEMVLYDFSMQPGDTMSINFLAAGQYVSGVYTLDSVTTFPIGAGPRRAFHLNCHSMPGSPTLTWVESVGQLNDVLYPYFSNMPSFGYFDNCPGIQHDFEQFMICFSHNALIYLDSCTHAIAASMPIQTYYVDSCNYSSIIGGIDETQALFTLELFPNPSNGLAVLQVELKKEETMQLFVYDVTGKTTFLDRPLGDVPAGKSEIRADLTALPDGFYLVEVRTAKGSVYRKLIVQH